VLVSVCRRPLQVEAGESWQSLYGTLGLLLWNPYLVKNVKLIGGIQRRTTKMIQGMQHWKYDDRLNYLGY